MLVFLFRIILLCLLILCVTAISRAQQVAVTLNLERQKKAEKTEKEALVKKDTLLLAEAYFQYGKNYTVAGDIFTSQKYLIKAIHILEKRGDSYELGRLYFWLCLNASYQSHYQDALRYAYTLYGIAQRTKSATNLMRAYKLLSDIYLNRYINNTQIIEPNMDSAYFYLQKFEVLARKMNDSEGMAEAYDGLGTLYVMRKDPKAIPYFKAALGVYTNEKKTLIGKINLSLKLAGAYTSFLKFDAAHQMLSNVKKLMDTTDLNAGTQISFELEYIRYYQATHNWEQAFIHSEKVRELEKQNLIADRAGAISRLNIEYETGKKEAQLKSQQQEIILRSKNERNQQRFLFITLALLLVALGATAAFYRLYRKNQRISQQNEELVKEQNHRVKNNLQVVSSLLNLQARQLTDIVAKRAVTDSQLRIQSMAILHRRLYDGEELAKVNLLEFIQELVQSVLKTFGYQSIIPTFSIDVVHLHADRAVPLGLIINELVTNTCKYAFPCTDVPTLEISCWQKDHKLQLTVADNGPGFARLEDVSANGEVVVASKKSFGMKLIKSQAEQLHATFHFKQGAGTGFTMLF